MQAILQRVIMDVDVHEALLYRKGFFGSLLKLAEYSERVEEPSDLSLSALVEVQLSPQEFYPLQVEAFEWSNGFLSREFPTKVQSK